MCALCCFRRVHLWRPCSHIHLRVCWFLSWPCRQVGVYIDTCVCVCVYVSMCICIYVCVCLSASGYFTLTQCTKPCIVGKRLFRYSLTVCQQSFPASAWMGSCVSSCESVIVNTCVKCFMSNIKVDIMWNRSVITHMKSIQTFNELPVLYKLHLLGNHSTSYKNTLIHLFVLLIKKNLYYLYWICIGSVYAWESSLLKGCTEGECRGTAEQCLSVCAQTTL